MNFKKKCTCTITKWKLNPYRAFAEAIDQDQAADTFAEGIYQDQTAKIV